MGTEGQISQAELKAALAGDIERLVEQVISAVNQAPGGSIIDASEEAVRQAMGQFRQIVFEKAIQLRADKAASAAFSPGESSERAEGAQQGA